MKQEEGHRAGGEENAASGQIYLHKEKFRKGKQKFDLYIRIFLVARFCCLQRVKLMNTQIFKFF